MDRTSTPLAGHEPPSPPGPAAATPSTSARLARVRHAPVGPRSELPLVFGPPSHRADGTVALRSVLTAGDPPRRRSRRSRRALVLLAPVSWTLAMGACVAGALVVRDSMFPRLGSTQVPSAWQASTVPEPAAEVAATAAAQPGSTVGGGAASSDPAAICTSASPPSSQSRPRRRPPQPGHHDPARRRPRPR